jgi:hypothetical protein
MPNDVVVVGPTYTEVVVIGGTSAGPQGASGGSYTHTQSVAGTSWTVPHNLGYNPSVTVVSGGDIVEGDITYTSNISLTLTFSTAISGVAYVS